ncbi:MAG TPA: xanthine dehydrogenase family protein subunit M [Acetobacteraceae bacterium]|nr:xanthine dehydrogenase family protein subunit M [Acetobacteraceae bacterium]
MKPAPFTYHDPATIDDAVSVLARHENARALAGGQSLMPMMNFRLAMPEHLIDLNGVVELAGIRHNGASMTIGAMTRQRDLEFSAAIAADLPIVTEALRHVGHRQTRNRGTIGGSLCHLDPSAELVNLAALHDGVMQIASSHGTRETTFNLFAAGAMTTTLAPDELLTAIRLAPWPKPHGYCFTETARRRGDFAIAAVGVLLTLDGTGAIDRAAIAVSGLMPVPVRLTAAETTLRGQMPGHEAFRAVAADAATLDAMEDPYASAAYRRHLARILLYRAMETAAQRARQGDAS